MTTLYLKPIPQGSDTDCCICGKDIRSSGRSARTQAYFLTTNKREKYDDAEKGDVCPVCARLLAAGIQKLE